MILTIPHRFHGPPDSGNGGYVCGRLAHFILGAATVRLMMPPPLETPLAVDQVGMRFRLRHAGRTVAEARPATLDLEVPAPPSPEDARQAAQAYRGFKRHWFPSCFVCGPARKESQGLRIFAGPLPGRDMVAAPWTPHPSLADTEGRVRSEFVWAALDCPGAFVFPEPPQGVVLLGEMTARLIAPMPAAAPGIVIGWPLDRAGRKHFSATALFDDTGRCCAMARATWLEVAAYPA
jgi:hypothetical protein